MRVTRRRDRRPDPFSTPEAVRRILKQIHQALPSIIPQHENHLVSLLRAARHVERYPASDTKRGRPSRFDRSQILSVVAHLGILLERETQGRLSVSSFVDHYLRVLEFPSVVVEALTRGDINLFEAEQLARLAQKRLDVTPSRARRIRDDLLSAHLQARLSGARLRARVNELL